MQNDNQPSTRSKDDLGSKARDIGRDLKEQASDLAQSATATVKSQAANVTDQAREVAADVGDKMKAAVADQKSAGADYVGSIADVIRRSSYAFDQELPQAGQYIRQAATQLNNVSDALRTRDISQLAGDVQDFARKQPAAFFGAAVLAGFAAVRFFKSAPERSDYGSGMSGANTSGGMASNTAGSYPGGSSGAPYGGASAGRSPSSGSTAGSYTGAATQRTPGLQR